MKKKQLKHLKSIAKSLEKIAQNNQGSPLPDLTLNQAYIWNGNERSLKGIKNINRIDLNLLKAIDSQKDIFYNNCKRFAENYSANNVLLWGARGMGKSSLVKAVHAKLNKDISNELKLIEIHREDIISLPILLEYIEKARNYRFMIFCDDLSFEYEDSQYKSLKTILEGGIQGRAENIIFCATSNRRHLMSRQNIENERSTAINPAEVVEEKISLSDRFGLWIGFHNCSQNDYFDIIHGYIDHYITSKNTQFAIDKKAIEAKAIEWSITRGARSGRVAWQFFIDFAGKNKISLKR